MTARNAIEQHYVDLAALPSSMPAYRRVVELVRQGCGDTSEWMGRADSRDRVELATALQLSLVTVAMRHIQRLSCGALIEVQVTGHSMPSLPPRSCFGMEGEMPELREAQAILRGARCGVHLPGEDLEAVALLLQAAAYLEQALAFPPGFAQTRAQ